ncbi:MAG TPA: hypothetical protein PLC52_07405 [Anaerolineales bacterium]|nr:hypothetical protein [Anaerolineales bacterium]HRQ92677.1 hypothetical protein [Anaerolineales bacterium]
MHRILVFIVLLAGCAHSLTASSWFAADTQEAIRSFTRAAEFDYIDWTVDAAWLKLQQSSLGAHTYLAQEDQVQLVRDFMALIAQIQIQEAMLTQLHANPDAASVTALIEETSATLSELYTQRAARGPLAEAILQAQIAEELSAQGFTTAGQPIPPVLYHSTPLPWALIVSARDTIGQEANLSLKTELTLAQHIEIEDKVAAALDVSTLVVPVGGIGTYPTMVAQTSSLNWLAEVISHEWLHNYLSWHALGFNYNASQEIKTMNETTANLFGKEIGALVISRYYPEYAPPSAPSPAPAQQDEPPSFDFRQEMHTTRLRVDELLAAGKVTEAEDYMEARRLVFWENGYAIRKLNQAYFAFYGSYADSPTGPAGEDPVGAAVRELRHRSASLTEFIHRMQGLTSFAELQALLASLP